MVAVIFNHEFDDRYNNSRIISKYPIIQPSFISDLQSVVGDKTNHSGEYKDRPQIIFDKPEQIVVE